VIHKIISQLERGEELLGLCDAMTATLQAAEETRVKALDAVVG
jgi:hypothetical protein